MPKMIYQIYDKMFKKILTLSSTAVINLINGLFETNYPPNEIPWKRNDHRKILYDCKL